MLTFFFSTFCMETLLLYTLMCHCHNPFGCTDTDSTSSLPCWLECFIELRSVWALDLKCEASVHSKPTMSGVSCLPPRSLSLYLGLPSPLAPPFSGVVMSHCSGKRTLIHWLDSSLPNSLSPRKKCTDPAFQQLGPLICNLIDYCPQA